MQRLIAKTLLPLIVLVVALFGTATTAMAQDTWSPTFDSRQHVYVDPQLNNKLTGAEAEVVKLSKQYDLEVFVVYARQGSEPNNSGMKFAPWKLDELVSKWSSASNFPHDNYLVILVIQARADANKTSVAANGGNKLQTYGLTASRFSDPSGPVMKDFNTYLPTDPKGYAVSVVRNVNADIDYYFANQKRIEEERIQAEKDRIRAEEERKRIEAERAEQERLRAVEHAEFMKRLPWLILWWGLGLGTLGTFIFLTVRYNRKKAKATKLIADWRKMTEPANARGLELESGYLGFLKDQESWQKNFAKAGKTFPVFQKALSDFAEFTARQLKANELQKKADAAFNQPFVGQFLTCAGYNEVEALLSTREVTIEGDKVKLEQLPGLFEGLVATSNYKPNDLFTSMEDLFDKTNKALASIKKAFEGVAQNEQDVTGLITEVDTLKGMVEGNALTFTPYERRFAEVRSGYDTFKAAIASDPLDAYAHSEAVEDSARKLKADLERAIAMKQSFKAAEKTIADAANRAVEVRGQGIGYQYPVDGKEAAPATAVEERFSLTEDKGNPDPVIARARETLATALKSLLAGQLDKSDQEKAQATILAGDAVKLIEQVLKAKELVQQQVPAVRKNLGLLKGAISAATKAVGTLKGEFQANNYAGQPEKLDTANTVIASTDAELAKVKAAYDEQRYLASLATLTDIGGDIQSSRDKLVELHARLTKLQELRQHAKDTTTVCEQESTVLAAKLKANSFTTSAQTDSKFEALQPTLGSQRKDVDRTVTDWPNAAQAADTLLASVRSVDKAIDQEKLDHERAVQAIAGFNSAITDAAGYVNDNDTRQPARDAIGEARQAVGAVQASVQRPKSNWVEIGRKADDGKSLASRAKSLAQKDKQAAGEARSAISSAESKIGSSGGSQGHNQYPDLSSANSRLSSARSALGNRDYERAEELAGSAAAAAASAVAAALEAARRIQAEIDRKRREEEERQRELERQRERERERERQAERDRQAEASRRSSNSGGGGFGGGGRSGGGGGGGGRSGGGGDF